MSSEVTGLARAACSQLLPHYFMRLGGMGWTERSSPSRPPLLVLALFHPSFYSVVQVEGMSSEVTGLAGTAHG